VKIDHVEIIPLNLPLIEPLVESHGTFSAFDHVVLRIHGDTGVCGLGEVEAYPSFERIGCETQAGIVSVLKEQLVPAITGLDTANINAVWCAMDEAVVGFMRVKAGIDNALYDLNGKALGVPAYQLLGGKVQDGYVVEGVGYGLSIGDPEIVAAKAKKAAERGYRQLELKAGDAVDPARDVERLRQVRKAIGRDIPIKVDFNGFYDTKTAIGLIREMEEYGVQWIEQPAQYWDLDGLARVRDAVGVTVVADESVDNEHDLMRVIAAGAADAIHIKPTIKGGLTTARKLMWIARAAGLQIVPGTSAPTGVGMAAAHAFIATCPHLSGGAHGSPSDILVTDIVERPIPAGSTYLEISDRPGLGIELNDEIVERYRGRVESSAR
jgi:L-alanine-DL-glutamate epimerase-like enolase superfamily enzyme